MPILKDALWDEVAGAKVGSDVVTDVNEVPEAQMERNPAAKMSEYDAQMM